MTLIKQEKLHIGYLKESSLCIFTKLFMGTRVSEVFQFWVSGSRNNRKGMNSINKKNI